MTRTFARRQFLQALGGGTAAHPGGGLRRQPAGRRAQRRGILERPGRSRQAGREAR